MTGHFRFGSMHRQVLLLAAPRALFQAT